jgi:parallel beta-helix repeat protein
MMALNRSRRFRGGMFESLEKRTLMSSYVVSTSGSDSAAGTSAAPWKTIQKAVNSVKAGDIVSVKAGTYAGFAFGDQQVSGTASSPITFKADAGVVINATNSQTRDGIGVENCNYIVLDGFTIQPSSTDAAWRAGIRFGGGGIGNVARNNKVLMRSQDTQGIYSSFNQNQIVENNEVTGNQDAGIYCSNSAVNPTVRGNYVHDLSTVSGQGVGIHFNGDISQGGTGIIQGGLIDGNRVVNCGTGISMDGMQNATVRNNVLQNIHGKGINLYMADAAAASKNDVVVNNTIVLASDGYFPIGVRFGSTNVKVLNNIGLNGSRSFVTDAESSSGLVVDYNIWGGANFSNDNDSGWMNFSSWQASGKDTHSKTSTASVLFVNAASDFHLLGAAPAVNAGTSTSAPAVDIEGKARPAGGAFDIGAFELGSVVTPTPTPTPTPAPTPATVPVAPGSLTASVITGSSVKLTWSDNSSNETGFAIEQSTLSGAFSQIGTVGAGSTNLTVTGLSAGTKYSYRVRAYNTAGNSGYSSIVTATTLSLVNPPSAPTNLVATAATGRVDLGWSDRSGNESNFVVERSTDGRNFSRIAMLGANVTVYSDTSVTAGVTYTYRVAAVNSAGASGYSNAQSARPTSSWGKGKK